ncbi:response regulator transcription factor [Butyrivibrio sp. WCD3002]|uniref:response regulator transcription factor n=1 Tax=Butyrivibrio sp. WCD3002 TaxID=1280676 RepID=UPI00040A799E|nr:response regulator [Butyrivibrio sp. WCD3002]
MQIIVIDDDMPTVDVIKNAVNWEKFGIDKVHTAYNIATAKDIFANNPVSLAICDIEMPMGSGLDLIKWAREEKYDAEFIFLTSHEKFDYARQAIEYNASGYVVKPFNADRMEAELITAIHKIHEKENSQKASQYEEWYSGNLTYVEASFWTDLLLQRILADRDAIGKEAEHRRLEVTADLNYKIILIASGNVSLIEENWGKNATGRYEEELQKVVIELGNGQIPPGRCISYHVKNMLYTAIILEEDNDDEEDENLHDAVVDGELSKNAQARAMELDIGEFCEKIIETAGEKLKNTVTIYISNPYEIEKLSSARVHLEELDKNNVASKGKVFRENDEIVMSSEKGHMLDQDEIRLLLNEKKKKELLNLLKFSMESLAAKKLLDAAALNEIRQDLLQTVYVYLHSKEIQATQLLANETAENLERASTESLMNMVRWQVFFISKTIDYVSEVEQSDSIVQRAKNFIHEHYMEEISRTEVAAVVFLTPEYMAKMFKKEEGVSLKQYISDYRVQKAKELLSNPSVRISDVAANVGFDNFSYFSTVFKKTTGYTPGEFHAMTTGSGE